MAVPGLPLASLLPIHAVDITMRFVAPARLHPFHQPALTAFLRSLLGSPPEYNLMLTLDAPESGRVLYRQGDRYRFSLFALAEGESLLQLALDQLRALPDSFPETADRLPFRNNLVLNSTHDFFKGHPVRDTMDLTAYTEAMLRDEVTLWQQQSRLRLRWLAPVRLLREKQDRADAKGEQRYCRNSNDLTNTLLSHRLYDSLADLLRRRGIDVPARQAMPEHPLCGSDLFWVDGRYRDDTGREQVMGGLMGAMELPVSDSVQWPLLVLGQYCGIGQRRAFGWGRYRLENVDGWHSYRRCEPATSMLERAVEPDNLTTAYDVIEDNLSDKRSENDTDDDWREGAEFDLRERLTELARRLVANRYQPPALKGIILRENDGGLRPLAIPPFLDRVLQRAVAQVLGQAIEPLLAHGSFGYRPRRSRQSARQMILEAYREGYRWVYESDIDDFFDSVAWGRLRHRLEALFGDDPVVAQTLDWMAAPVTYQDHTIQRSAGLPQGSPLSPLLANLMLDDFDSDLESAGFKLARFADDFVILCRNRDEAEAAARAAETALTEVGLRLNRGKTHIRSFAQGFRFLGYLFVNAMALDVGGRTEKIGDKVESEPPPGSWLAQLARKQPSELPDYNPAKSPVSPIPEPMHTPTDFGERSAGTTLFVTGDSTLLYTDGGRLRLRRGDEPASDVAWRGLSSIVLIGPHQITTPALRTALHHGVAVHFASSSGRYQGCAWHAEPGAEGWQLWRLQQDRFAETVPVLEAARSIVDARLRHQREVLRQRSVAGPCDKAVNSIDVALRTLPGADSLSELNGLEGTAARAYFAALQHLIPQDYGFEGRNRQPPRDPFNALLSLGYTVLYAHVDTVLRSDGLLPWIGFYHRTHGRHAALASDLMEPFRHLVERTALLVASGHRLRLEDFRTDPQYGCRLLPEARRRYLRMLSERFETPIKALGETESKNLHGHLHSQNLALIAWLRGHTEHFRAWRQR